MPGLSTVSTFNSLHSSVSVTSGDPELNHSGTPTVLEAGVETKSKSKAMLLLLLMMMITMMIAMNFVLHAQQLQHRRQYNNTEPAISSHPQNIKIHNVEKLKEQLKQ